MELVLEVKEQFRPRSFASVGTTSSSTQNGATDYRMINSVLY